MTKYLKILSFSVLCVLGGLALATPYKRTFLGNATASIGLVYAQGNEEERIPPQLARIAQCESNNQQTDKNGKIIQHKNKDGSIDYGKYQINLQAHKKELKEMNLNIFNEKDNTAYALYLYQKRAGKDWEASRKCWK